MQREIAKVANRCLGNGQYSGGAGSVDANSGVSVWCSVDEELPQEAAQEILAAAVASTHPTCQQIVATSFELGKGGSIGVLAG